MTDNKESPKSLNEQLDGLCKMIESLTGRLGVENDSSTENTSSQPAYQEPVKTINSIVPSNELKAKSTSSRKERYDIFVENLPKYVLTAYNQIPKEIFEHFKEDMVSYYKEAFLNHLDLTQDLISKLANSFLAPKHELRNSLVNVLEEEKKKNPDSLIHPFRKSIGCEDLAKYTLLAYWRNFGHDNGWTYINIAHTKQFPKGK